MAVTKSRQLGFTFLLFVPLVAYWGYDYWIKWYRSRYNHSAASGEPTASIKSKSPDNNESQVDQIDSRESAPSNADSAKPLTPDDYRRAFSNINEGNVTRDDAKVLISMLRSPDSSQLSDGLKLVIKLSVSSPDSKNIVFDSGVTTELMRIVRCRKSISANCVGLAVNAINNLSLSDTGQNHFTELVSDLIDCSMMDEDESLATMSLQCLTNLSVTNHSHDNFTKVIQCLYTLIDTHPSRRLNVCRLLVNLSSNAILAPYMLAAKHPTCAMSMITEDENLALRWLRVLSNITTAVNNENISESALPTVYKAPSPETMFAFLYGKDNQIKLGDALLGNKTKADGELNTLTNTLYKNIQVRLLMPRGNTS